MKLVSVIMPAYQAGKYIRDSIQSVVNQTYDNWELIMVNDGSEDNTKELILEYVNLYPDKCFIIDKKINEGTAEGLNTALSASKGDYICWLSADDLYVSDMIESQVKFLEENKHMQSVFSRCEYINENSKFIRPWKPDNLIAELLEKNSYQPYRKILLHGNCFYGCSVLGKKDSFHKAGKFNPAYRYAHDYDYWLRFCAYSNIGFINKINVRAREYEEQITKQGHNDIDAIHVFLDFIEKKEVLNLLMEKAGLAADPDGIMQCFEGRLQKYACCDKERKELYHCFLQYCKRENNVSTENKGFIRKFDMINNNYIIPNDDFFEEEAQYNYLYEICKNEKIDAFVINNEGIRFDKYTAGNNILRLNKGLERDNELLICRMKKKDLDEMLEQLIGKIKYKIVSDVKENYLVGFSAYMIKSEAYNDYFINCKIKTTGKTIWSSMFEIAMNYYN